ncbi:hypothetical protein OAY11_01180 [Pelagibacteraceae bacterium]|nr:hypothetical protein [Pelagibacteraceae bacterium]
MGEYQHFFDQYFKENYKRFSAIAGNQLRRFGIRGDIIDLQNDVVMSIVTKFINRYQDDIPGIKELIKTDKLNGYLITSIRNFVSDLRDKQNNDPLGNQIAKVDTDNENEKENLTLNKPTSSNYDAEVENQNPEKINESKQLYNILCSELDEESVNIWLFIGRGYTFLEISKKLNINHNTIRTKWTSIRLKAMNILKRSEKVNEY